MLGVDCWGMTMTVEKISAVTFRVLNMKASVRFYKDVLGMEIIYGGEDGSFFFSPRQGRKHPNPKSIIGSDGATYTPNLVRFSLRHE